MRKPEILEHIAELQKARSERTEMDADWVLKELRALHSITSDPDKDTFNPTVAAFRLQRARGRHNGNGSVPRQPHDFDAESRDKPSRLIANV